MEAVVVADTNAFYDTLFLMVIEMNELNDSFLTDWIAILLDADFLDALQFYVLDLSANDCLAVCLFWSLLQLLSIANLLSHVALWVWVWFLLLYLHFLKWFSSSCACFLALLLFFSARFDILMLVFFYFLIFLSLLWDFILIWVSPELNFSEAYLTFICSFLLLIWLC